MSFFNSLVNQMGRETGRDIYRSIKSAASRPMSTSVGNSSLIYEVSNFEFSTYDKVTYNRFVSVTEKFYSIDSRNIDFVNAFDSLFKLITRIESQLGDKYDIKGITKKMDSLLKLTATEYIKHTEKSIDILKENRDNNKKMAEVITDMNKNKVKKFIITALGLNSMFYDFGVQKVHTMFSLTWVAIAVSLYVAGYHANPMGYFMGAAAHSMTFLMAAWLRPKAKDYTSEVVKIETSIEALEKSIEIVNSLK